MEFLLNTVKHHKVVADDFNVGSLSPARMRSSGVGNKGVGTMILELYDIYQYVIAQILGKRMATEAVRNVGLPPHWAKMPKTEAYSNLRILVFS
jgi:hypothetical protein